MTLDLTIRGLTSPNRWYSLTGGAPVSGWPPFEMMLNGHQFVRLEFTSAFEMLDLVQLVGDTVGRRVGLDDDGIHWVSVALRECVINAIKHGNRNDAGKRVFVDFEACHTPVGELTVTVRDQGEGFDPDQVADPLAVENLLKSSGRGIFLIRNFMDDVQLSRIPEGGMQVRMVKKAPAAGASESA